MVKRLSLILLAMGVISLTAVAPVFASGEGIGGFVKTPQQKPIAGRQVHGQAGRQGDRKGRLGQDGQVAHTCSRAGKVRGHDRYGDHSEGPDPPQYRRLDAARRRGSRQAPRTFVIFPLVPPSQAGHTTPHTSAFDQLAGLTLDGIELGADHRDGSCGAVTDLRGHRPGQLRPGRTGHVRRSGGVVAFDLGTRSGTAAGARRDPRRSGRRGPGLLARARASFDRCDGGAPATSR